MEQGIQRLIDAYAEGLVEKEEFASRVGGCARRCVCCVSRSAQDERKNASKPACVLFISGVKEFAERVQGGLVDATWAVKRQVCERVIKRVEIDKGEVHVIYRVGLPPFEGGPSGGVSSHCNVRAYAAPLALDCFSTSQHFPFVGW